MNAGWPISIVLPSVTPARHWPWIFGTDIPSIWTRRFSRVTASRMPWSNYLLALAPPSTNVPAVMLADLRTRSCDYDAQAYALWALLSFAGFLGRTFAAPPSQDPLPLYVDPHCYH